MHIQRGLKKDSSLKKFAIDAHPIIEHFLELLTVREIVGTYMKTDKRMKLDDDKVLALLIHHILTTPHPLYEIQDWLKPLDTEAVGLAPEDPQYVQDDRIGRALARFYTSRHQEIFFRLALRAIKLFELDCSQIHQDTTTITFAGKYPGWSAKELLTNGINKDHRPDLKQLVLGLTVTADGSVPLVHHIYDGNQTDDRLHPTNHKRLQKLLQRVDFIYVADCKLATAENLQKISAWGGLFVTVMPKTWKEDGLFREKVRHGKIKWKHILACPNNRKPYSKVDRYYVAEGDYKTSHGYRLHWIRSTQKAAQDLETRMRRLEQALDDLRALPPKLNRYKLKQRKQINQRIQEILKNRQCQSLITYEIHATREYQHIYPQKGRPTQGNSTQITWKSIFSISFGINKNALDEAKKNDGIFPLITNLDEKKYASKRILEIYKFQPFLEKRNSQIKTYQEIAPVYLKNGKRVVAFLHIHVMALMVATLIERKLRLAMKNKGISALPIYPENRPCKTPTMFDIVRLFTGVERYEVYEGNKITIFPAELTNTQKEILSLLEVSLAHYQ